MKVSRSAARSLAWGALAGQLAFIASWVVGGALQPGYSHLHAGVSRLGADDAAHPWIVNAGLLVLGLSIAALGPALRRVLPARRAATVAVSLFLAAGVAMALTGPLRMDCVIAHCRGGAHSWHQDAHIGLGFLVEGLLLLTPFALARALWPGPLAPLALTVGVWGVAIAVLTFVLSAPGRAADGLVQRAGFGVIHLWVLVVAVGVLHATRRRAARGGLVAVRPRDFLASTWTGEGELVLRPLALWRPFAQHFAARRESTWVSDRVWRVEDESRFGDGRVQRRLMYCEWVGDDQVRLTAGDLPEGAEVWVEPGGFRIASFSMAFPVGPLRVPLRCRDRSYVEPDGTLVNVTDARLACLAVPVARLTFRMRPGGLPDARAEGDEAAAARA